MPLFDILFGDDKKRTDEETLRLAKAIVAEASKNKKTAKFPNTGKTKYVTKQCKYCGYRVTYLANGIPPGVTCPKRGKGQPHVWQTLGYSYK